MNQATTNPTHFEATWVKKLDVTKLGGGALGAGLLGSAPVVPGVMETAAVLKASRHLDKPKTRSGVRWAPHSCGDCPIGIFTDVPPA